ncbi:MAG: TetR family transcriptional regulator [Proteobacteria bacterium]|nr:TetR family transcriptional regulator [Pseudomonadota bacterium]
MVRRTKQDALATRNLILDTAELVFERRGVSRTSLNEIAESAGLTRGAIYWHFKDKADLFDAMMQRVVLPMEEAVARSDDPGEADPLARVRQIFIEALRKTVKDPQVHRVFEIATHKVEYVDELEAVRDRRLAVRNNCMDHVARRLTLAMRRGLLGRRVPARAAALGLHALIDGLIQNWMLDPDAFDLVRVGTQVIDACLAGLAAEK